ncbi:MAG: hypothetical protein OEZ14_17290, partial [Acidimicrobiia bacterium]|nr:hypothetical protein [Acidimicrobiia bacterium]
PYGFRGFDVAKAVDNLSVPGQLPTVCGSDTTGIWAQTAGLSLFLIRARGDRDADRAHGDRDAGRIR